MDAVVAKAIESRKKSIGIIEKEVSILSEKVRTAVSPSSVLVLREMAKVKEQRLVKLRAELAGLEQLLVDERQVELPGTGSRGPGKR